MEKEKFYELIVTLKNATDKQTRADAEQTYFAFRAIDPTDNFINLLCETVISAPEQQYRDYAAVLLRQDIEKQQDRCCFNRMRDVSAGRQIMLQLMNYAAASPNMFLTQVIREYAILELFYLRDFSEIFSFIEQAYNVQDNEKTREMAVSVTAGICTLDPRHFPTVLDFLHSALQDQSDSVASQTVYALHNLLQYDITRTEQTVSIEMRQKIVLAILQRIGIVLNNGRYEVAEKILATLCEIIDMIGEELSKQLPQIMLLLEQICLSEVTEQLKCKAIYIFEKTCDATEQIKKQLEDQIIQFFKKCVIVNLSESLKNESNLKTWVQLKSIKEAEYDDQGLQTVSEQCVQTMSLIISFKNMQQIIGYHLNNSDMLLNNYGIHILTEASEGIYGKMKQNDVNNYVTIILKLISQLPQQTNFESVENSRIMRHKYDIVECLSILAEHFSPMIQKQHKSLVTALINVYFAETSIQVKQITVNALFQLTKLLSEKEFYLYASKLTNMVDTCLSSDNMENQVQGLDLLSVITSQQSEEDNIPLFNKFMPNIFNQFELIMQSVQNQQQFNYIQTDFIETVLKQIEVAVDSVPALFQQNINALMQSFIIILERSLKHQEFSLLQQVSNAIKTIMSNDAFKDQCQQYVEQIYQNYCTILSQNADIVNTNPEFEGEVHHDNNLDEIHSQTCFFLHNLMEIYPRVFLQNVENVFQLVENIKEHSADLLVGKLSCFASIVTVVAQEPIQLNFASWNQRIFSIFQKQIIQIGDQNCYEFELRDYSDLAEVLGDYISSYITHVVQNNDKSQYQELIPILLQFLHELLVKADIAFAEQTKDVLDSSQYDADEKQEEIKILHEDYDEFLDNLGAAYSEFIMTLQESIDIDLVHQIMNIAEELQKHGCESDAPSLRVIQAINLYADFAQFSGEDVAKMVFQVALPKIENTIQVGVKTENWQLLQIAYFALQSYLDSVDDVQTAQNQVFMNNAVQLLDVSQQDGHEHALTMFDVLCNYLVTAGKIGKQQYEFWNSLIQYCTMMDDQKDEVAMVLEFFVKEIFEQQLFTEEQLGQQVNSVIIKLFFGQYYSKIKNFEQNKNFVQLIAQRIQQNAHTFARLCSLEGDYVRKNASQFCQEFNIQLK